MRGIMRALILFLLVYSNILFAEQQLIVEPDMGRAPLLQAIANAKTSVDVVMYGFTDMSFVNALISAQNQHKNVRVLLQHTPYKAEDENQKVIERLQAAHIPLVWPDGDYKFTHQKTLLIDDNTAIIMTFNLTHSSFKNERNFALITTEPTLVKEIKNVYAGDWTHKNSAVVEENLLWSPNNSRDKILSLIRGAKSSIQIYAEGLSDYQIIGVLAKAARTGIKVQIMTNTDEKQSAGKQFSYLKKAGVTIANDKEYTIHAKMILIDNTRAELGSINFTKNSINNNRELAILTQDPKVVKQLEEVFTSDWRQSTNASSTTSTLAPPNLNQVMKSIRQVAQMAKTQHKHYKKKHRIANDYF